MQTQSFPGRFETRRNNGCRILWVSLIALFALILSPLPASAQSCPGTTQWNGGSGNWETAGDWSSGVPGATSNACINVANSTVNVTATSGDTTLNLDINLSTDILNIGNNDQLTIASGGNILNNGALNLNSGGNITELIIAGATTLSGTGTLTMSNNTNNFILGGGTFTNDETIQGAGNIGNGNLTLVNSTGATIDANVSSTLQINPNGGTTNKGTLEATAGGILELSGSTVANTGGLIQATGTGSTVELNNVSITGGTLTSSSGGIIESVDVWNSGATPTLTGVTISTGTIVDDPNNNGLNLGAGTITNNGTINLLSTGNITQLVVAGSTTLAGSGTVTMSNNTNNFITGGGTLTNNETIQGAGSVGNGDLTLINNGTIDANVSSILQINPNGGTTNNGTLEATSGGTLELSGSTIANGSGLIEANGGTVDLNDVSIAGGTLTSSAGSVIQSINVWNSGSTPTLTNLTISSGTNVNVPNNNGLNLGAGTITNNGNINLESTGNITQLVIAGATSLSGTGAVTMSNNTNNEITGGGTLTNNETIQGSGVIGNASLTLVNNGTIDANQSSPLTINPNGGTTNTKTLEATAGGTLVLATYGINNAGGTILATGTGSTVELNSVSITGGTLTSSSGGIIESVNVWSGSVPTLTGVTISSGTLLDIPNNNGLDLGTGTITNSGTINLQSGGNNTELVITGGNVTLTGGGNVTMSDNSFNIILAGTAGLQLTNVNNAISGSGNIGDGNMAFVNDAGGTVDATSTHGNVLTITTGTNGATNLGLFEATAGGTLQLENTLTNTGGTILATGAGALVDLNAVSITGGTLTSNSGGVIQSINVWNAATPTLTNLTISTGTTLDIPNNDGLNLGAGTITNNGTINLQSTGNNTELVIAGSTTLAGTGTVTMSNNGFNLILGGGTLTNNETIQGAGSVGDGNLTLVNNGTIDANVSSILQINPNGGTTNNGTLEATSGGTLELSGSTIANGSGLIEATGSGSTVDLNDVSITGGTLTSGSGSAFQSINVWNSGNTPTLAGVTISTGTAVNVPNNNGLNLGAGTVTNNGTINLQSGGNITELVIAGSTTLAGTGTVTMSNNTNNIITGGGTLTNKQTIQGSGNIGNNNLSLVNSGTIDADQSAPLTIQSNLGDTNTGKFEATSGGTLILLNNSITNTGGTILATGTGSTVELNNVSITGGTLTSSSGGILESVNVWNSGATPTLTGVTISSGTMLDILNNNGLNLGAGTITNKGTINLESGGNITELVINGNVTLAGTGKVIMSANGNNFITGTSGSILTNQNTIEGEGNIGDGQIGVVNTGTIFADETGTHTPSTLVIDTGAAGFSNNSGSKNGTITVDAKNTVIIEGGAFNNYNSATGQLTGGIYKITGTLEFNAGTLGIVTNDANITLTSATAEIFNTSNSSNALSGFSDNASGGTFTLAAQTFNDANVFTNSGTIAVGAGSKFDSTNQLTNFNSSTSTLTGGTYTLTGTGQFQFNNQGDSSDIVTNDAHITLAGVDTTKSSFIDQSGNNALANFAANGSTGSLTLTTDRNYSTPGNFSNAGVVDVQKSTGTGHTQLTISGTYTQTGGTTTVDGLLTATGAINVSGGFIYGNLGTITGNVTLTGGTINPGDGLKKAGKLNIAGSYTQSGAGILNIDLGGTSAGTNYDVLNISGAAALGGTLDVDAIGTFNPTVGQQYDILDYGSETGSFSAVDCTFSNGDGCTIAYNSTGAVLTITAPAAPPAGKPAAVGSVNGTPARWTRSTSLIASDAGFTHEPSAILTPAETCSGLRTFASFACITKAFSGVAASMGSAIHSSSGSERASTTISTPHNNVAASISGPAGRGGASHAPDARTLSAASLARVYVCAYLPSEVASTMGCR